MFGITYLGQNMQNPEIKRKNRTNEENTDESNVKGHLGGSAVEHLPLAQGVIPGYRDQVLHQASCMKPASPSACVSASLSLCVFHEKINKIFKK